MDGMMEDELDMMMGGGDAMTDHMMNGTMAENGNMTNSSMVDMGDMGDGMNHGDMNHGDGMDHGNMDGDMDGDMDGAMSGGMDGDMDGDMSGGDGMDHGGHMNHGGMNSESVDTMESMDSMDNGHMHHGAGMSSMDSMDHGSHGTTDPLTANSGHLHGGGTSNGFCNGEAGMVMLMGGFQWVLKGESTCINLYFPGWTLDSAGKVVAAMLGVIALAIATEAISKYRHSLSQKAKSASAEERKTLSMAQIGLHGVHALTGYILMLATMTYSLELLLCVILGLIIGYATFGGDTYNHVTTNPCCAFLEDEAMERDTPQEITNAGGAAAQDGNCCPKENRTIAQSEISNNSSDLNVEGVDEEGVFSA